MSLDNYNMLSRSKQCIIIHEKAKRIARVIVNDIRNYNTDNLAEGIQMGNIMKTLGKEVERGRLLYIKRVPQEITRETNYYREALIKILADGQVDLLGLQLNDIIVIHDNYTAFSEAVFLCTIILLWYSSVDRLQQVQVLLEG